MIKQELFDLVERGGDFERIETIIKDNPDLSINDVYYEGKWTLLHTASYRRDARVVKLLLEHPKIDVNPKTAAGRTPFTLACDMNHLEIIKILVDDPRTDLNMHTCSRLSALFHVVACGMLGVLEMLIASYHCDIKMTFNNSWCIDENYTSTSALEAAENYERHNVTSLIKAYESNPTKTRSELRRRLYPQREASRTFCLILMIYNKYFSVL